jgi:hypothetical protein
LENQEEKARLERNLAILDAQRKAQEGESKLRESIAKVEQQTAAAIRSARAAARDTEMQDREKEQAKAQAPKGKQEMVSETLTTVPMGGEPSKTALNQKNELGFAQGPPGPQPGDDLGLPGVPGAPPFLMDMERTSQVRPEQRGPVSVPTRTSRTTSRVRPNVLTAAQRAQLQQGQAQFQIQEARRRREFEVQEGRLERELYLKSVKAGADVKKNRALTNLYNSRNMRELEKARQEGWDTYADRLAKIIADPWTEGAKALGQERLAVLPDEYRADVEERAAVFEAEFKRKAAGTGTVEIFNPDSKSGITELPARDAMRLYPEGWAGVPRGKTRFSVTKDGDVLYEEGGMPGAEPTRTTIGNLQEAVKTSIDALSRVQGIEASYDPYFLTHQAKIKMFQIRQRRKANIEVSAEDRRWADKYRTFAASTMENLNLYIKDITGAQMSHQEAKRLKEAIANLDLSDIEFESDLRRITKELRMQIARSSMLLSGGFGDENIQKVLAESEKIRGTTTMPNGKVVANSLLYKYNNVSMRDTLRVMKDRYLFHLEEMGGDVEAATSATEQEFGGVRLKVR